MFDVNSVFFMTAFIFALTMSLTPRPNNIMLLASSLNHGVRQTLPHALGIICGVPLMACAVGMGLGN